MFCRQNSSPPLPTCSRPSISHSQMDSAAAAAFSPHQTGDIAQSTSYSEAAAAGSFSQQQQPQPAVQTPVSSPKLLPSLSTLWGQHLILSLRCPILIKWSHWSLRPPTLYWRMQMKPYLLGQGVFHFVDGSVPCPPSQVSNSSDGSYLAINPVFLHWKQ